MMAWEGPVEPLRRAHPEMKVIGVDIDVANVEVPPGHV